MSSLRRGWEKLHYSGSHASAQAFSNTSHIFLLHLSQMTQAQLETLQTENQHLKGLLQRLESQSPKVCLLWHSCDVVITVLQTAADRFLFLTLSFSDSSLCVFYPLVHVALLRGGIHRLHPWGRVMCHLWATWSKRIGSWGRRSSDWRSPARPVRTNMNKLCSAMPWRTNPSLHRRGTWFAQTHNITRDKKKKLNPSLSSVLSLPDVTNTGRRRRQRLAPKGRSRSFSNSCTPCRVPLESTPVARLQTAGLIQQHPPPLPPPVAQDSAGETQCQVQMTLLLMGKVAALKTLCL